MVSLLRFIGVANVGVWFGAAVFMTFFAGPAFFSKDMLEALSHKYYAGLAAEVILGKYFLLHYLCAAIALAHWLAEWFYFGRKFSRITLGLWALVTGLVLFGGLSAQPRLRELHQGMYYGENQMEKEEATAAFRKWHGASQMANVVVLLGLGVFLWRTVTPPPEAARYGAYGKYRG